MYCTRYLKFKYIFQFLTTTLPRPIDFVTFIGLRWRIRGVLSVTSNVKGQIERKMYVQKFAKFWVFRGPGDQGVWKVAILLQKAHPCVNTRRVSHFASKSVRVWPPGVSRKKSQKVSDSHRNDVSPLTQGLRYRAACDIWLTRTTHIWRCTQLLVVLLSIFQTAFTDLEPALN